MLLPLLIVGGIGAAVYFGTKKAPGTPSPKPEHQPAPQAPEAKPKESFGPRFQKYLDQINKAAAAFKVAKAGAQAVGLPWTGAAVELRGTLDVVGGMARNDLLSGAITEEDHKALQHAIEKTKELL